MQTDWWKMVWMYSKLRQTQEELAIAWSRLADSDRILGEHAEYEDIIRRAEEVTISEADMRTNELRRDYLGLKEALGRDPRETMEVFEG